MFFKPSKLPAKKAAAEGKFNLPPAWAVVISKILSPEIKEAVVSSISTTFNITAEEASNIVESAPVILLDDLSRITAEKVKECFRATGAEVYLSNDPAHKAKCCRTIWPEAPDLSLLEKLADLWSHQKFMPRKSGKDIFDSESPSEVSPPVFEEPKKVTDSAFIFSEAEEKHEETSPDADEGIEADEVQELKGEMQDIYQHIDKIKEESRSLKDGVEQNFSSLNEGHAQWQKQQETLQAVEKKYQEVQGEFSQWAGQFESQFQDYAAKLNELESRTRDWGARARSLESFRDDLQSVFYDYCKNFEKLQQDYSQAQKNLETKFVYSEELLKVQRQESEEVNKQITWLSDFRKSLQGVFDTQKNKFDEMQSNFHEMKQLFEQSRVEALQEIEQWKRQAVAMSEKALELEKTRKVLEIAFLDQKEKLDRLQQALIQKPSAAPVPQPKPENPVASLKADLVYRENKMREKLDALEKMQSQIMSDLQERFKKESSWEQAAQSLGHKIDELKQDQSSLQKKLQEKTVKTKKPKGSA